MKESNDFNSLAFAQERERERELKMSRVADGVAAAVNHLFGVPETLEKFLMPSRSPHQERDKSKGVSSIPVDILDSPKEYIFFMDVPGLSKSDIQVIFAMIIYIFIISYCEICNFPRNVVMFVNANCFYYLFIDDWIL